MDKYIEVIKNLLPLLDTMEEAISYLKVQISELRYENSFNTIRDVSLGIESVEDAISPMMKELPENEILNLIKEHNQDIKDLLNMYEKKEFVNVDKFLEQRVNISFTSLKKELNRVLKPYIES